LPPPSSKTIPPVSTCDAALAVFARAPLPGQCKTRLIPSLRPQGAAAFQRVLLADTLRKVAPLSSKLALYLMTAGAGFNFIENRQQGISRFTLLRQRGGDLGERLENAFRHLLRRHTHVLIIGTDSPQLTRQILRQAIGELRWCDAVLGPCPDGGYYLIGLRREAGGHLEKGLLHNIRWGSARAFEDTLRNLITAGLACSLLEPLEDVDRPEDFMRLKRRMIRDALIRRRAPMTWRFLRKESSGF
jgi:rSAM/selenodomain-associated transferase 1